MPSILILAPARKDTEHRDQKDGDALEKNPLRHHPVLLHTEGFARSLFILADKLTVAKEGHQPSDQGGRCRDRKAAN